MEVLVLLALTLDGIHILPHKLSPIPLLHIFSSAPLTIPVNGPIRSNPTAQSDVDAYSTASTELIGRLSDFVRLISPKNSDSKGSARLP